MTIKEDKTNIRKIKLREKAERNLEEACGMFGWDEYDNVDRAIHAKNFIKACILREVEANNPEYNFKHIINLIENNPILKKREESHYGNWSIENVYNSINIYINLMQEGKLSGIVGYNAELYSKEIAKRIKTFIPDF
jgi:hypothetical protein